MQCVLMSQPPLWGRNTLVRSSKARCTDSPKEGINTFSRERLACPDDIMVQWDKKKQAEHWFHLQNCTIFNISTVSGHTRYHWKWSQAEYGLIYGREILRGNGRELGWVPQDVGSISALATDTPWSLRWSLSLPCSHGPQALNLNIKE